VHPFDDCFSSNPKAPENAIGFKEKLLLGWIVKRNLIVTHKYYGTWCGRPRVLDYQDLLVCKKPAA
jgi:hypothetical protein